MKNWADMLKNITMLTQFGLSFVTPVFLCQIPSGLYPLTAFCSVCAGILAENTSEHPEKYYL